MWYYDLMYRELVNVANGVKLQIDANISALDLHEDPPVELEQLTTLLEQAIQLCDTIITKGEDEPDEQSTTDNAGGTPEVIAPAEGDANATPTKEPAQKAEIGQVFEDQQA